MIALDPPWGILRATRVVRQQFVDGFNVLVARMKRVMVFACNAAPIRYKRVMLLSTATFGTGFT
jgi:hypothetical protein